MNDIEQIEALQDMNKKMSTGNALLRAQNKKLEDGFIQAIIVLEDIADRFDMIKSITGVEWISELQQDIQHVLDLEKHFKIKVGGSK